jgi:hypothetical protein
VSRYYHKDGTIHAIMREGETFTISGIKYA